MGKCRDIEERLKKIRGGEGGFYFRDDSRLPVKVVFIEKHLPFDEAFAKFRYLQKMNRRQRSKLIEEHRWPIGGTWRKFIEEKERQDQTSK